jgi:ATP-binding cassette subfamily C (CFTR/MRP) protein 1
VASEGGGTLLWVLFRFFKGSLLLNAIPRLILIAFRYSQPILINSTIRYVTGPVTEIEEQDVTGYNLILAAFVIYVGTAVSCSLVYRLFLDTNGAIGILLHLLSKSPQNQGPVPWRTRWAHSR